MARIIGIDLGTHSVRLAVLEGGFGRFQTGPTVEVEVAPPQEGDGPWDARFRALAEARGRLGPGGPDTFGIAIPAELASLRTIRLPFTDKAQIAKTLRFEVEQQVPFDLDDMVLADRFVDSGEGGSRLLCGMLPKATLAPLLAGLREEGADPKIAALDTDLYEAYLTGGTQALVDIGHSRTLVVLARNGLVLASRALAIGASQLIHAIAVGRGVDESEVLRQLKGKKSPAPVEAEWGDPEETNPGWSSDEPTGPHSFHLVEPHNLKGARSMNLEDAVRDAMVPLITELRGTLITFEDVHELEVDELLLAGGGAHLPGIRDHFGDIFGVPVRTVAPNPGSGPEMALAWALAWRTATGKGRSLDFRVGDFAFKGDLTALGNLIRYGAVAALALSFAGVGFFGWRYWSLSQELAQTEADVAALVVQTFPDVDKARVEGNLSTATAIMNEKTAETTAQVESLSSLLSTEPPTLGLLRDLSESVPAHNEVVLDVSELSIAANTITLKLESSGFEQAAKIEASLQRNPRFKQARKSDEKKVKESVRFAITIPLEEPEAPSEEG
jgi:Tfp pilus assembly PilM family ATPase